MMLNLMSKIETPELHRTPGGRIGFFFQLKAATQCARQHIAELKGSRKKDMAASGAIHALALLAREAAPHELPVEKPEVEYWRETFFAWLDSVKRQFAESCAEEFRKNAEADFQIIRDKAGFSQTQWERLKDAYEWPVRYGSRQAFDLACERAKARFPVELGRALDKYLQACVERLLADEDPAQPLVAQVQKKPPEDKPGTVAPRLITYEDGVCSLIVTSFGGLQRPSQSGTGLERSVRQYLQKNSKETLSALVFDSESSMFCVRSSCLKSLAMVSEAIYSIAANAKLK